MYQFQHAAHMSDDEIKSLYDRMEREGLLPAFFYAAQCKSASDFLSYARDIGTWMFRIDRDGETIAFAAMDNFSAESAYLHHCHFRAGWRYTLETAKHTLEWLRTACPSVTTLIGVTPKSNRLAIQYAERGGFKILGVIPRSLKDMEGNAQDAVVSVHTWGRE